MIDISVSELCKFFGTFELLKNITFDIYEGEKVGLIGKNGAGKTTLLNILREAAQGSAPIDGGKVLINPRARIGIVDQIPAFPADYKVEDVMRLAFLRFDRMAQEISKLERVMSDDHSPAIMERYGALVSEFEFSGGYDVDYELERVAAGLMIDRVMREQNFYSLSGGERTRVNLARVILERSDILLLDEPTNHLDIASVEWLGEYLDAYKGTVVLISHDRWFLDRIATSIIEIENGESSVYDGNYSYFVVEKERRFEEAMKLWKSQTEERERLEAMARRYRSWATEQAIHKAKVVEHKIERMTIADRPRRGKTLRAKIGEAQFRADEALKITDIHKSYGDTRVLSGVTQLITGGEHICIYGPNGCGKSTLLNIIANELEPDAGRVSFGLQTKWAYLPQIVKFGEMEKSVLRTLLDALPIDVAEARNRLGAYLFQADDVYKPLSVLSGGELSRLKLCILMYRELNFLILDEPTNHLDLASREWLEDLLDGFHGVILFVSHDRYFITRFATRVWELTGGCVRDYLMGFEEFRAAKLREQLEIVSERTAKTQENRRPVSESPSKEVRRRERRRENATREAASFEHRISELDAMINLHSTDYEKLSVLLEEKTLIEEKLLECYEILEERE